MDERRNELRPRRASSRRRFEESSISAEGLRVLDDRVEELRAQGAAAGLALLGTRAPDVEHRAGSQAELSRDLPVHSGTDKRGLPMSALMVRAADVHAGHASRMDLAATLAALDAMG